ncbi:MAG: excinuclease ABC subunit C [Rhodospirillaceae bacterium TMED8]|nr:excinuclease ABC subunit C [Magnetovibrio sp.]OUT47732.1 MAG: excinuclease ABC subunit C [Rhodospirillaceae bacterium TMED8]|tara:strand:- start:180 stop:2111 length:1932 start_codon:yes stop_codon:yes gene_type:complete
MTELAKIELLRSDGKELPRGVAVISAYLKTLPNQPGVYRMINADGKVLYVGKAKSLKVRVAAYTHPERQSVRIRRMIFETASMEFVTTHTEAEALLLESNLIKHYAPRYNILLRDDKSFPYILVTHDHQYARIVKHRGGQNRKGDYFGPFASVWAVNETLAALQRTFLLRTCTDAVFANRTRPCLLYQIKRCAGPCVDKIDIADYAALVAEAREFLTGDSHKIQRRLARLMQEASNDQEFELAAQYRDRIRALTRIQAHQNVNLGKTGNADIIAGAQDGGATCIQVFFFRSGTNYGNRAYFPVQAKNHDLPAVLEAFIGQFYARTPPPQNVILGHDISNLDLVAQALSVRAGRKVEITVPKRGDKVKLVTHAVTNARQALERRLAESASQRQLLEGLAVTLDLDGMPDRIEVYDNSHISGTHAIGAMIVVGPEGFDKNAYRKFNIKGDKTGILSPSDEINKNFNSCDDYAMMREVLTRRFSRALKEGANRDNGQWPDLVLVDGGKGQLSVACEVFQELGIEDIAVAAIAKGPDRNAGRETVFRPGLSPLQIASRDPVSYFLQRIRDEAHRFAVGSHRNKRSKTLQTSILDEVPGIGAKRKKALLHHFGDARAVSQAGRADLGAVEGVSSSLAEKIYDWFHSDT